MEAQVSSVSPSSERIDERLTLEIRRRIIRLAIGIRIVNHSALPEKLIILSLNRPDVGR